MVGECAHSPSQDRHHEDRPREQQAKRSRWRNQVRIFTMRVLCTLSELDDGCRGMVEKMMVSWTTSTIPMTYTAFPTSSITSKRYYRTLYTVFLELTRQRTQQLGKPTSDELKKHEVCPLIDLCGGLEFNFVNNHRPLLNSRPLILNSIFPTLRSHSGRQFNCLQYEYIIPVSATSSIGTNDNVSFLFDLGTQCHLDFDHEERMSMRNG